VSIYDEGRCVAVAIVAALQPDLITLRLPDGLLVDVVQEQQLCPWPDPSDPEDALRWLDCTVRVAPSTEVRR